MSLGNEVIDWNLVKENVEALWAEFQIPMWVTEFDWNGDEDDSDVPWGDHSQHAQILEDFYKLMFSQEVGIEMFYLNSTLNFEILSVLVFQLEVYDKVDRLLTGLTVQQKGTTARWYSNKTSLLRIKKLSVLIEGAI